MTYKLRTEPMSHQKEALDLLMKNRSFALFTECGSGKTKIMIDLINNKEFMETLVVCPAKVCSVWITEFEKHSYDREICVFNLQKLNLGDKIDLLRKERNSLKKDRRKRVFVINYENVWRQQFKNEIAKHKIDCIICDESHRIKGAGSKCSLALTWLGRRTGHRYLMTGTPLASSPLDIYAQYRFLDPTIFGTNYDAFKGRYANMIRRDGYDILDKSNPYKNLDELHTKMFAVAYQSKVDLKLPSCSTKVIRFNMSKEARDLYDEIKKNGCVINDDGTYVEASNILATCMRLQQIACGFTKLERLHNGRRQSKVVNVDSSRINRFKKLLAKAPFEPIVVFFRYKRDKKNLIKACNSIGLNVYSIDGESNEKDNWQQEKGAVLLVQIQSGAEGIDLTYSRICIYYDLHQSLAFWEQSKKRIHRKGQTRKCKYFILLAKDTIDEDIYKALENKRELVEYIMDKGNF